VNLQIQKQQSSSPIIITTTIAAIVATTETHYDNTFDECNRVLGERNAYQFPIADEELLWECVMASFGVVGAATGVGGTS